jgi:hypothetical protein
MDRNVERDVWALQRIVALLFLLADVADGVGRRSRKDRVFVLSILRHVEATVWGFAIRTACGVATTRCAIRAPSGFALTDALSPDPDDTADAVRLAASLRALALILAGWATRQLACAALLAAERADLRGLCFRPGPNVGYPRPAAPPAPDTS